MGPLGLPFSWLQPRLGFPHTSRVDEGGGPEGMETSACLVSFPSRCTLLFDPGVGTPPEARGLGGGELDSKISVRDCVSGTVCPGVRRPVGAHGVLVGGGRGVGGLVGGLGGGGTRTWPEAWRVAKRIV